MNQVLKPITPVPVVRDENGYWMNPEVDTMLEVGFEKELVSRGMEAYFTFLADEGNEVATRYSQECDLDAILDWDPQKPCGDGWFIASICYTKEGPACLWLRQLQE